MNKLSIRELKKRKQSIEAISETKDISIILNKKNKTMGDITNIVENFLSISENQNYSFEKAMEYFAESWTTGICKNDLDIQRLCNILCENMIKLETTSNPVHDIIIKQTRDARNIFKRNQRHIKNYLKDVSDPNTGSVQIRDLHNKEKKDSDLPGDITKKTYNPVLSVDSPTVKKVEECYIQIQETAKRINSYDRVLNNYKKLSKRFNVDKVVQESRDYELCVYELCSLIDSYDMPFGNRYNVALENILHLFDSNDKYTDKNPMREINEYFFTKDITKENLKEMRKIISENDFYNDEDDIIDFIMGDEIDDVMADEDIIEEISHKYFIQDNIKCISEALFGFKSKEDKDKERSLNTYKSILEKDIEFKDFISKYLPRMYKYHKKASDEITKYLKVIPLRSDVKYTIIPFSDKKYMNKLDNELKSINILKEKDENDIIKAIAIQKQIIISEINFESPEDKEKHLQNIINICLKSLNGDKDFVITTKIQENGSIIIAIKVYNFIYDKKIIESKIKELQKSIKESIDPFTKLDNILEVSNSKSNPVKDLINDFKKSDNKSVEKMKILVNKIYTKSPENIIDETPNFLIWFRTFTIFSMFAIQPLIAILVLFTDQLIALKVKRKEADKIVKQYESEIEKTKNKIEKTKSKNIKERLEVYLDTLEKNTNKLENYRDNLYTDRELDERDYVNENCLSEGVFDKISLGDELKIVKEKIQFEFKRVINNLKSQSTNKFIKLFENGTLKFQDENELKSFNDSFDNELGRYLDNSGCISMCICKCDLSKYKTIEESEEIYSILQLLCNELKQGTSNKINISYEGIGDEMHILFTYDEPLYIDADIRDEIKENYFHPMTFESLVNILTIGELCSVMESNDTKEFIEDIKRAGQLDLEDLENTILFADITKDIIDIDDMTDLLMDIKENAMNNNHPDRSFIDHKINNFIKENVYNIDEQFNLNIFKDKVMYYIAFKEAVNIKKKKSNNSVSDKVSSITNTLNLAKEKLNLDLKNLSDKEKVASRNLDASISVMSRKIEDASTNKNREAIIKGQVLPSASKTIKLAIVSGAVWAINPAIAVIGALGMLFTSKNASRKERSIILDEIDIELKVVEREIQQAESDGNPNKLRQLYKIQKTLQREKQRLKYRMQVYYNDRIMSSSKEDD